MNYLENLNKNYNVGIYIRLSREDYDKQIMSESVINQKSLLLQYVKENNLTVYDIYVDDGYSGTNFDRPGFKKLIEDIESKKINMVITKDMSRLGRDYIGTGNLIEKYFPEHNIRYIAVTDNIDTYLDNSNSDIAPFKAIMNDMYAKDISKKIKSSLRAKQKEGKWVGGRCPFGYMQALNDKNHLVINKEQAIVVKRIFDMCLEGLSFFKIAKRLTEERVKTPAQYYSFEWKNNYNLKLGQWNSKSVRDILTNQVYIGDLVQNRRSKVNYKVKKVVRNNPKDYIIVEGTHEPIIDKEIFYEVQKIIPKNVGRCEKKEVYLLDGLMYCGDCGHRISVGPRRKKDNRCYTICNYYRTYIRQKFCTLHCNNYDVLEQVVLDTLRSYCLKYLDCKKVKERVLSNINDSEVDNSQREIKLLEQEINCINENLDNIYLDKLNKVISEEQFNRVKVKLENKLKIKQDKIIKLNNNSNDICSNEERNKIIEKYINEFLSMKNPSRELVISLIERVDIYEDKEIKITVCLNIDL